MDKLRDEEGMKRIKLIKLIENSIENLEKSTENSEESTENSEESTENSEKSTENSEKSTENIKEKLIFLKEEWELTIRKLDSIFSDPQKGMGMYFFDKVLLSTELDRLAFLIEEILKIKKKLISNFSDEREFESFFDNFIRRRDLVFYKELCLIKKRFSNYYNIFYTGENLNNLDNEKAFNILKAMQILICIPEFQGLKVDELVKWQELANLLKNKLVQSRFTNQVQEIFEFFEEIPQFK